MKKGICVWNKYSIFFLMKIVSGHWSTDKQNAAYFPLTTKSISKYTNCRIEWYTALFGLITEMKIKTLVTGPVFCWRFNHKLYIYWPLNTFNVRCNKGFVLAGWKLKIIKRHSYVFVSCMLWWYDTKLLMGWFWLDFPYDYATLL